MNGNTLISLGFTPGPFFGELLKYINAHNITDEQVKDVLGDLFVARGSTLDRMANMIIGYQEELRDMASFVANTKIKPYFVWGREGIQSEAIGQMDEAMSLPVAVRGAVMPDSHLGYGLPIGGAIATRNEVIPNAVGVDISCRMKLSIIDRDADSFNNEWLHDIFRDAIVKSTRFGMREVFEPNKAIFHPIIDDERWQTNQLSKQLRDKAILQLGSSGGGNHFASLGTIQINEQFQNVKPGRYAALLTHSGSRGSGAAIAAHYKKIAAEAIPATLRERFSNLGWLSLDSEAGQEYWSLMNLMGDYAQACHQQIHDRITSMLSATVIGGVDHAHNFAWKEMVDGEEMIVHRKGATPAGKGVYGMIPGTMADDCHLVVGLGNELSINSASHGAGRRHSRTKAKELFTQRQADKYLADRNVHLIAAGLDECPMAYKNISEVMDYQTDLVKTIGIYNTRIVRMADDNSDEG